LTPGFIRADRRGRQPIYRKHPDAVAEKKIQEMDIASLLLVNCLFTQSCRMQIYSMKDLLLSQEQINSFDRAMDIKEIMDAEKKRVKD
jgi:phosphate:Na+ symporter